MIFPPAAILAQLARDGVDLHALRARYERLYSKNPPSFIAHFAERVPMVKGRCDPGASTATSYSWFVWMMGDAEPRTIWIPPCRKRLEREGDYAEVTA